MRRRSSKPLYQVKIAKERIDILFSEAKKMAKKDDVLAKRYVRLAKKIGMRYNVRINQYKRKFCKHCNSYLKSGYNSKHRLKNGIVTIKCFSCNKTMIIPYKNGVIKK